MSRCYLSIGSNLGDRCEHLASSLRLLGGDVEVVASSDIYETEPLYRTDQPAFLNQVVCAETGLSARELLERVQAIEVECGRDREREVRNGPRPLDIDIVLFDDAVIVEPDLQVPHPRLAERRFVLVPLLEIAPALCHPVTGVSLAEALEAAPPQGIYRYRCDRYT